MKLFLGLVDSNAPLKKYQRIFNFTQSDFNVHIKFVPYYRLYVEMSDKVKEMQKLKKNSNALQKIKINNQVRQLRAEYRPLLLKARGMK